MEMWDCGHLKVKQWPEGFVHSCARSRQEKVWYRICDLFAKINLSLVYSANKNVKYTSLSPVECPTKHARLALCAVFVRSMCGVCAALVRSMCGVCAVYMRL